MNKKIMSLVLVLTLVLGSFSFAFADTKVSSDVVGTSYEDAVTRLSKLSILTGYPDGSFKPENTITRAEFSAAVARARGFEAAAQNSKGDTPFTDVTANHWASGYVNTASKAGLVNGMGNGIFAPESQITYEQAVTLVVRALGYEAKAAAQGGYPYGHLSVASESGLLDDVKGGVQGTPATRGLVAQLLDNALDIEKMIQVGFGDQAKWVVSGTENTDKQYLFDDLGFDRLEKAVVESADHSKGKITVRGLDKSDRTKSKTLNATKDFNFAAYEGLKATVWFDKNDNLIDIKLDNDYTVKFDAIEVTKDGGSKDKYKPLKGEIKLITEDKKYDVTDEKYDAKFTNKNDVDLSEGETYNFAKIILDENNDITWVEAYELDQMIVVNKVEKDTIKGYDGEELEDLDDYTIIKDGRQILASDLKDKDVVVYDDKDEYAAVLTITKEGKIERIYKDQEGFKLGGKTYGLESIYGIAKYINGDDLEELDEDVLEEMQDNGDVRAVLSFDEDVVLVDGKAEEVASNYAMIEEDTVPLTAGRKPEVSLDILNSEGKVVEYNVSQEDIEEGDIITKDTLKQLKDAGILDADADFVAAWNKVIKAKNVVEVKLNASGKVKEVIPAMGEKSFTNKEIKTDDSFAEGKKLKANSLVFWADGEEDIEDYTVLRWGNVKKEFTKVEDGTIFYNDKDEVIAIYAGKTDNDEKGKDYVAVVTKIKELSSKENRYDIEFEIKGKEYKGYTAKGSDFADVDKNDVRILKVAEESKEVKGVRPPKATEVKTVVAKKATGTKLTDENNKVYDIEGIYYDNKLEDVKAGDAEGKEVTLYFEPGSERYVQVVVIGKTSDSDKDLTGTGTVTHINTEAGKELIEVEFKDGTVTEYKLTGSNRNLVNTLSVGDVVKVEVSKSGALTVTVVSSPAADEKEAAKVDALIVAIEAGDDTTVTKAEEAYNALTKDQQALVKKENVTALEAAVKALNEKKAQEVDTLIEAIDLSDDTTVTKAREGYDALTKAQQALVKEENVTALTEAEKALGGEIALKAVNAATDKYEMRKAVNDNLKALGIKSSITLEAADYLFTKLPAAPGYADIDAVIAVLDAYAAL